MDYQSSVMLERLFFRAFFAELASEGQSVIDWRSDETDARFRCVYEYLRSKKHQSNLPNLTRLISRLRPDPLTGASPALDTNLMHMQPGSVRAPNPSYGGGRLSGAGAEVNRVLAELPKEMRSIISGATRAFIRKESTP
jgi:hypothetical protein